MRRSPPWDWVCRFPHGSIPYLIIDGVALGTWQSAPGEVEKAVSHAIAVGYRHIDTAFCYQNEQEVGQGIKEALASGKVKREDLFVTTKLWCSYHTRVEEALDASLKNLGLDYIDLYLMHWPVAFNPNGRFQPFVSAFHLFIA